MSLTVHAAHSQSPEQALRDDLRSLGALLDFYRPWLLRLAAAEIDVPLRSKLSASDLVQKTHLRALESFPQFRGATDGEFRAWLVMIMKRQLADAIRYYQAAQMRDVYRERPLTGCDRLACEPADSASSAEIIERLIQAIEQLPEGERMIVRARYLEQQSFAQIGQACNLSREQVRRRWLRAIEKLACALADVEV